MLENVANDSSKIVRFVVLEVVVVPVVMGNGSGLRHRNARQRE